MTDTTRILLAEDEEVIALVIEDLLEEHGFELTHCPDGQSAWERLQQEGTDFGVILLDRQMPHLDGLALLRRIKAEPTLAHIPVIMETAMDDKESVREGLHQGAYYYLTKPFEPDVLLAVVRAALQQAREMREMVDSVRRAERPLAFLYDGVFRFRAPEEGRLLANYLARACPEPERAIQGLQELLLNAVEHGNLAISYQDKSELLKVENWETEVQRRLTLPEYRDRRVEIRLQRDGDALSFTITDQGAGFDWKEYLEFSPERAFDLHGRGIAMANKLSFDRVEYRGKGNQVVATVWLTAEVG